MTKGGWSSFLGEVSCFYEKCNIDIPKMDDIFLIQGKPQHKTREITNLQYYQVKLFYTVIDIRLQDLNSCFTKVKIDLLLRVTYRNSINSFVAFDKQKLVQLAQFYPKDFSPIELIINLKSTSLM